MKAKPSADPRARVAEIRAERDEVLAAAAAQATALLPAVDAIERAERWCDELAASLDVNVGTLRAPELSHTVRPHLFFHAGASSTRRPLDPMELATAIACRIMPDAIRSAIREALAAAEQASPGGLPLNERPVLAAESAAKVRRLDEIEEATIVAAAAQGILIGRRQDVDPVVVFGEAPTDREEHAAWLKAALTKLEGIEEPARQEHERVLSLNDRRLEAVRRMQKAEDDKRRAEDMARQTTVDLPIKGMPTVPASYDEDIAATKAAHDRIDASYRKAQDRWRELNACLPVLRDALHVPGRRVDAA